MTTRLTVTVALILIAISILAGLWAWDRLPSQMASHWNLNDEVDGTTSKFWGTFLMPLISLGMLGLFLVIPAIDPLKANIAKFRGAFNLFIALVLIFLLYMHGLVLAWNLGVQGFRMSLAMLPLLGLLFIFIGYMLRQAKRNFFIGIRTPWTLSSDRVWDRTHQLGSILFTLSGILTVIGAFFGGRAAFWWVFVPLIGSTLFLVVYSYFLYQKEVNS